MDLADRRERVRLLWAGDAVQETGLLWRCFRRQTIDPARLVALIAEAGRLDPGFEVESDTLQEMQRTATHT